MPFLSYLRLLLDTASLCAGRVSDYKIELISIADKKYKINQFREKADCKQALILIRLPSFSRFDLD